MSALLSGLTTVNVISCDASLLPRSGVQIILFSATFPDHVRNFASKFAPNANKIELQREELSVEGIRQFYMDCKDEEHKYDILVSLYQLLTIGQSIIFCQVSKMCSVACSCSANPSPLLFLSTAIQQIGFQNGCLLKVTRWHHCTVPRTPQNVTLSSTTSVKDTKKSLLRPTSSRVASTSCRSTWW